MVGVKPARLILAGVVAVVSSACGRGSDEAPTTTEVMSVQVSTTIDGFVPGGSVAMPVTPGVIALTPEDGLDSVAKAVQAIDRSVVSTGECGTYAMLITRSVVYFMSWDGRQWNDQSDLLQGGRGFEPVKVISRDYTNDGVTEFLVVYADEVDDGGRSYGAIFGYPWDPSLQCRWTWMDIDNGRDLVTTFESPDVPLRKKIVYGYGYRGSQRAFGKIEFSPAENRFVFTRVKRG